MFGPYYYVINFKIFKTTFFLQSLPNNRTIFLMYFDCFRSLIDFFNKYMSLSKEKDLNKVKLRCQGLFYFLFYEMVL